jgi:protease-4
LQSIYIINIEIFKYISKVKDFIKHTLATVVGIFIFGIITCILMLMSIVGMMASSSQTTTIDDNSVLVIKLKGEILDHSNEDGNPLALLIADEVGTQGLDDLVEAIKRAKQNDEIKGIYIEAGQISADPATVTALRDALKDFKTSKKFIVAYADQYSQGSYYISSVADKVWINPQGMLALHGMASQKQYMRDFLAKIGIKMQVVKVGQYKSATETYTEDHMSDANREQVTAYVTGIWNHMLKDIAESRKLSVDSLNAYADRVMDLASTETLKKNKLIDGTLYTDQIKGEVKKLLKIDDDDDISQVSVMQMLQAKSESSSSDNQIAIYFCEGSIVQEPIQGYAMGGSSTIVGNTVCKDLEKLAKDEDVKAVVIRINSGGGDAYASEQMWHQIVELKKVKPVVISMGGMAASGGYYMSCGATWIVAEPTTLTGSIGIFGTFPDISNLMTQKLGFKYDEVKTNKNSTMSIYAQARPFSGEELTLLQGYIDRGYALFRKRVADGRHLKVEEVEKIAQGHVWLGKDAIGIKLVDQLGSLKDAIDMAAKFAKIEGDDYYKSIYPAKSDWTENILQKATGGGNYLDAQFKDVLGEYYEPFMLMKTIRQQSPVQARMMESFKVN